MKRALPIAAVASLLMASCGTIFHGTTVDVAIRSTPGCTVTVDGANTYQTPTIIKLKRGDSHTFKFEKEGYKPVTVRVDNDILVGTLIADIFLTGVIGVVVDLVDGAMYTLEQKEIEVALQEESVSFNIPETTDDEVFVVLLDKTQVDAYYALKAEVPE
ncbi:MAG: PEGA domain-containing protein [candidate division Zixibacteria bacterium]|nr:PEGA domain-containing protein [candidate division Zixibacteria bacterium]